MVKIVKGKIRRYAGKVIINIPTMLFMDSKFPFLQKEAMEPVIIEIKGGSIVIRKGERNDN
jgi:hypothetical protein